MLSSFGAKPLQGHLEAYVKAIFVSSKTFEEEAMPKKWAFFRSPFPDQENLTFTAWNEPSLQQHNY
jgi:hypothetical protein